MRGRTRVAVAVAVALGGLLLAAWWLGSIELLLGALALIPLSALLLLMPVLRPPPPPPPPAVIDWTLLRALADQEQVALAITDRFGQPLVANDAYQQRFGDVAPGSVVTDGRATTDAGEQLRVTTQAAGQVDDCLIWRFDPITAGSAARNIGDAIAGAWGVAMGDAGLMAAVITRDGQVRASNRALALRATGGEAESLTGKNLSPLLAVDERGTLRFEAEGAEGQPLRLLQIPVGRGDDPAERVVLLLDEEAPVLPVGSDAALHTLLSMLPVGLALVDRDGRFLYVNAAFMRAAGVPAGSLPTYPSDLVIAEDKATVADAVRRFALGRSSQSDIAVRLRERPEEPIALTVAGARGLGEAAVLLSLKDNSEESRLKREVAQATKMQAVGQLAGGVAHDFNNILTGIIGHCDLMLMRHTPGDSDYDDIQQIRLNSNRAAGLTRQLLAFSRQQTLRPQVLQLPDVVSEVSNLLKRLLGETVQLTIQHGRGLAPVRADPGQLEQVIVNLAVNARDAMPDGGSLTLTTYGVTAADVRKLGSDVLPIADYVALTMTDSGQGIPDEVLPKIFEPFFTTKEVGKGTGLGLSTVYGIVKQSGGFIFADSKPGETSFTIYLPVHAGRIEQASPASKPEKPAELWGSGNVLLVEDEDMVRAVAERALTRQGYTVTTAANGEEAWALLDAGAEVDLLISDVVMPVMDGPALVRRARERHPDLRVLFMSGYAEEQLRRSIDIERVRFLAKPFSVKQLAEATQAALA